MMRLVLFDLRDHATTWIGAYLVAVACGYIGGWVASLQATAGFCEEGMCRSLQNVSSLVFAFSLVAAVAVLTSAANLTVSVQRRSYALWQLVNVSPHMVSAVVLVQLAVVALLGAACGTLLTAATFIPLFPFVFSAQEAYSQVVPHVGVPLMPVVWLGVVGVFLCGGLKGARNAGRTPPLLALREPEPKREGMTWMRVLLFAGLAVCTCWAAFFMTDSEPDAAINGSLFLPLLVVATLVPVAGPLFSLLLSVWTSLVPQRRWNAWYLARRAARYGLNASTSVETPIMVGFGLVAGIFSTVMCWVDYAERQGFTDINTIDLTSALLMLGGPVLLCAVGAAASVVMSSRSRTHDVALLVAAGARPSTLMAAAACEAFIHTLTATMVGAFAVVISNIVIAYAIGLPLLADLAFGEGLVVSLVGFALVLAATLIPTHVALKKEAATVLAGRERG